MCFIVRFSELERGILSATYYNTGGQLRQLAAYVTASKERSLLTILKTFMGIVNTGKSAALPGVTVFNDTVRCVLRVFGGNVND
jgi:hypothetical protein